MINCVEFVFSIDMHLFILPLLNKEPKKMIRDSLRNFFWRPSAFGLLAIAEERKKTE